jgi:hypothetical protein
MVGKAGGDGMNRNHRDFSTNIGDMLVNMHLELRGCNGRLKPAMSKDFV